jgi:hypothetical protein
MTDLEVDAPRPLSVTEQGVKPQFHSTIHMLVGNKGRDTTGVTVRCQATDAKGVIVGAGADLLLDLGPGAIEHANVELYDMSSAPVSYYCRVDGQ